MPTPPPPEIRRPPTGRRIGARLAWFALFAPLGLWGFFALYEGSWPRWVGVALALLYAATHLAVTLCAPLRRVAVGCLAAFLLPLAAFLLMRPSHDRVWQPDAAQLPYAEITGEQLTLHHVRHCVYRTETDYTPAFETRRYDLAQLRTADVFLVDWGLGHVAHTMVSFGFADGQHLCFSIETRKEVGEQYSAFKGLFRQYELMFIAGDERDLVRLRTNFRQGETVRLYRLVQASPQAIRGALLGYLARINELRQRPAWYNAVSENCMIGFFQIARQQAVPGRGRWNWTVLLNGHADRHAYDHGSLDQSLPFAQLRERSVINRQALAAGDSPAFSALIRQGLPGLTANTGHGDTP